ncbi:MAG: protein kinase [Candidatus Lokiarchaeota archaeon]|nr:protein kinase [Candidatus Lokiarchaeota archaeon]
MIDFNKNCLIAGRYKTKKKLGAGAFGSVFLAEQEAFDMTFRSVALKLFNKDIKNSMEARQIFNDAIVLLDLIENCFDPYIQSLFIYVYDIGSTTIKDDTEGLLDRGYITMELMETDLRTIIGPTGSDKFRRTTVTEALNYMKPVISALAFMHSQKYPIIHRDLKPGNILFRVGKENGKDKIQIKVADFGLAVQIFNFLELPDMGGTIAYQDLESFTIGKASTESDVYAIGIMLYELLTGKYPYDIEFANNLSPNTQLSKDILNDCLEHAMSKPVIPPSDLNYELKKYLWLEEIIMACIEPSRINRTKNAKQLKLLIENDEPPPPPPPTSKYKDLVELGKNAMGRGREQWNSAEKFFKQAIQISRKHCDAISLLAHLLIEMDKIKEAELLLRERIEQNRECCHIYQELAYLYGKRGLPSLQADYLSQMKQIGECKYSIFN